MSTLSNASWIEPIESDHGRDVQRPAYCLATSFHLDETPRSATLHATAHGFVELFINDERVTDDELLPGFTAFRKRLQVHSFDVTALVRPGQNTLRALLSDGWWRGQHSGSRRTDEYGATTALLAELHVDTPTGARTVATDDSWRSSPSHILAADVIAGETHDLRVGLHNTTWQPVRLADHPKNVLVPADGPATRRIEELAPVAIREVAPKRHVVDFGQNIAGWIRLHDLGPTGTTHRIVYGETLDTDGDVTQHNIADNDPSKHSSPVEFQTDTVISAGDDSVFEPRHSVKGFQYVRLEGREGDLDPASIRAVVVHSDLRPIGGFQCSDDRINRLHAAADWSFRGNACEIPTDCPHREHAGWTGDWQLFIDTAAYLYDVYDFSARWLKDLAAEQWEDGTVLNFVPDPHDWTLPENFYWRDAQGSAGWGDAACHVPWTLYVAYGRAEILNTQFDSMKAWVDHVADRAANGRHASRLAARTMPADHERFVWDTGFHFGEWTEPDVRINLAELQAMDHGPTATAFFFRSTSELAQAAAVIGRDDDAAKYSELAANIRLAWQTEFLDADGRIAWQRQANLVRAIAFNLLTDEQRDTAVNDLVSLIRDADTHLGTGFLATPFLLPVLADNGQLGLAYELLMQDTPPSWLYMIDQGATTIWEDWNGRASRNHYSKGAVISFLHRYTAGLTASEPGYRRFRVAPRPGGGLTSAATFHDSPHGRIDVSWQTVGDTGSLELTVPAGTSATVELPDGSRHDLGMGAHTCEWSAG